MIAAAAVGCKRMLDRVGPYGQNEQRNVRRLSELLDSLLFTTEQQK
jgi:hypothetical protein